MKDSHIRLLDLIQRRYHAVFARSGPVDQPATGMLDDHKYIQQTKSSRHGDEEIAGNDSLSVQA
jgi:hypothetical protein